jgi:integrase
VKASSLQTATTAINRWQEQCETRRLSTIDATEAERWAQENGWAVPPVVTMLNDAERKGIIDPILQGPFRKGPGRRYLDPLTVDQVEELATIAEQHHGLGAFVRFTAYSGMRVSEFFGLEWGDVDFDRMRIMVRRRVYHGEVDLPKSGRVREIASFEARDALLTFPARAGGSSAPSQGGALTASRSPTTGRRSAPCSARSIRMRLRHFSRAPPVRDDGPAVAGRQAHSDTPRMIELYGHGDGRDRRDRSGDRRQRRAAASGGGRVTETYPRAPGRPYAALRSQDCDSRPD